MSTVLPFAIGIPTLNRYDLLQGALARYQSQFPNTDVYVLDNGHQGIAPPAGSRVTVLEMTEPLSVAASWNRLCAHIFYRHSHALILNDDIVLGCSERNVSGLIDERAHLDLILSMMGDWCVFLLPERTFVTVGGFDERFAPAYFEDVDYRRRMELLGLRTGSESVLNPSVYRSSMTSDKDPSVNRHYARNAAYYCDKWGGVIGGETFRHPFNNPAYHESFLLTTNP